MAWNDEWTPTRNKNAYSLFNNAMIINRGQVNLNGAGSGTSSGGSTSGQTVLYNFSQGTGQWKGTGIAGGPWQTNELSYKSTDSLKADIKLTSGARYTLFTQDKSVIKLAGKQRVSIQARVASWGFTNGGTISAKLYMKCGSAWKWYDSGAVTLNSNSFSTLTINLSGIPSNELGDVQELGVDLVSNASGSSTSVYLAYVVSEA